MSDELKQNILLVIIIFIGFVLRTYGLFHFPLSHDELSALYRCRFSSFSELIEQGVKPDGHPALIQVFLYYWTHIFGTSTVAIRFPFYFISLLCIPLSYFIGKDFINKYAGLVLAAAIASLEFPLTYSLYARPYITGLFFTMGLFYAWNKVLFENKTALKYWICLILCATLSFYNHYFSMLFAGIILLVGVPFAFRQKVLLKYILSALAVGILFLPHISIFKEQLSHEGLDWLGKPDSTFLWGHIRYIFHFSSFYFLLLGVLVMGFFYFKKDETRYVKQAVLAVLFLAPFFIGYYYSVHKKPILQYSLLYFSFPYLILLLASFISSRFNKKLFTLFLSVFLILNLYTLFGKRAFLLVSERHPFNLFAEVFVKTKSQYPDLIGVHALNPHYVNYYLHADTSNVFPLFFENKPSPMEWRTFLQNSSSQHILLSSIPLEYIELAKEYFPYPFVSEMGYNQAVLGFSKTFHGNSVDQDVFLPIYTQDFLVSKTASSAWKSANNANIVHDSIGVSYSMTKETEYGPGIELLLDTVLFSKHAIFAFSISYLADSVVNGALVIEIKKGDETKVWSGMEMKEWYDSTKKLQKTALFYQINSLFKSQADWQGCVLKAYVWNKEKNAFKILNLSFKILKDNPYQYALLDDI